MSGLSAMVFDDLFGVRSLAILCFFSTPIDFAGRTSDGTLLLQAHHSMRVTMGTAEARYEIQTLLVACKTPWCSHTREKYGHSGAPRAARPYPVSDPPFGGFQSHHPLALSATQYLTADRGYGQAKFVRSL